MLTVDQQAVATRLKAHVKQVMPPDPTGHDWPHVWRVLKHAEYIAGKEGGDMFQVTLMALTHDLYDHKFFKGTEEEAKANLEKLLHGFGADEVSIKATVENVFALSYSKGNQGKQLSKEGKMVQDADRLEAIGAIGIARAFAYGGFKSRMMNEAANQRDHNTTFDHFFEKLLKLYDLLNTNTAREMAKDRFAFMQEFASRFAEEWGNS